MTTGMMSRVPAGRPNPPFFEPGGIGRWSSWTAAGSIFLLVVPIQLYVGRPLWSLPAADQVQAWLWAWLLAVLGAVVRTRPIRVGRFPMLRILAVVGSGYGVAYLAVRVLFDVPISRGLALICSFVTTAFLTLPPLLGAQLGWSPVA